jgi:hypothetical protein
LDNHVKERKIARERGTKKDERDWIRKQLEDTPRVRRREEITVMDVDKMEEEIKKTEETIDDNLWMRAERAGIAAAAGQDTPGKRARPIASKLPWLLMLLGAIGLSSSGSISCITVRKSIMEELYSLLEPEACPTSDGNREVETVVYREIVQIKQDHIIPIFRCEVVETIISQYCGHWSAPV